VESEELDKYSANIKSQNPISISFDNTIAFNPVSEELDDEYDLSGIDMVKAISDFVELLDIDNKEDVVKYTTELYKKS
jgi:hypothetical protein